MNQGGRISIRPLDSDRVDDVVRLHRAGMGYTLNSKLGAAHMRYLYQRMSADPDCYVGIALEGNSTAGVVSGTVDAAKFTSKLIRTMHAARLAGTAIRIATRPALLWAWIQSQRISAPVWVAGKEIRAVLTAIVVDDAGMGKGTGRALVEAFEQFLAGKSVRSYRLDTQIKNERAKRFYERLGFREVTTRADSIIFVRSLN